MAYVKDRWKDAARKGRGKRWLAVWLDPDGREWLVVRCPRQSNGRS